MRLRYGMNPHQDARAAPVSGRSPIRVLSGAPSYINLLDALSGWQLVREAAATTRRAAAASFKHVSPALLCAVSLTRRLRKRGRPAPVLAR